MNRTASILILSGSILGAALILQPEASTLAGDAEELVTPKMGSAIELRHDDAPPRRHHRAAASLTSEQIERVLQVAEEIDSDMASRLRTVCDRDPDEFHRVMRQSGRRLLGLAELKHDDPDLYQIKLAEMRIEAQVDASAAQLVDAIRSGRDVAEYEEDLRRWVRMQVLHSIRARGHYILRLKEHMERLEQELELEAQNFDKTVERRFQDILTRSQSVARAPE
jgi:hypothetical protein